MERRLDRDIAWCRENQSSLRRRYRGEYLRELVARAIDLATRLIATTPPPAPRGGRKGRRLAVVV